MPLQQLFTGVGTSAGPSWTVHDDKQVWMAWKGEGADPGIYVASSNSLHPDPTTGKYSFSSQQKILNLGTSASPAITSLNGTLYLFFKGESDGFIYWATSADGKTWVDNKLLGLGDSLIPADNNQHPETSAAPAVVAANGCLYLFWKGHSDGTIFWTASKNAAPWMEQASITTPNGTPLTDASPAVAVKGQTIHLIVKGQSDDSIWWTTYSTPIESAEGGGQLVTSGPWSAQSKIFSGTIAAPSLVCDGNGVFWLAWTDQGGSVSFAFLNGNQWSAPNSRAGIGSSDRPALVSTGGDAQDIVMAWKGEGTDPGIYYGTLTGPLPSNSPLRPLLVIAPQAFMSSLAPLIAHKNKTGMSAVAVSIESITSFFPGADEPEQIKRAICLAREKLGARYVMLVGDAANFPVRFWYLHQSTPAYANNDPIPTRPWGVFIQSDLYYASLYHHTGTYPNIGEGAFDNWDANGNGLYNEAWLGNGISDPANTAGGLNTACNPDGVDGYPDIAVGRVPAASAADVQTYVNKIIAYESRSAPEKLTFTFVADQIYGDFDATTGIAGTLSGRNVAIDYLMIENTGAAESPFSNATPQQVAAKAGASNWLSYLGHGGPTVWGYNGVFTSDDVALTKNASGLPIVFAAGCGTALFMPNLPWSGFSGAVTSIDIKGVTHGPYIINPSAAPGLPGLVITDSATGQKWGIDTPGCDPLPVTTPLPAPINISIPCCADLWLLDNSPGGGIVYLGDHCVSNDSYPAEIETNLLGAYVAAAGTPVLGDLYLTAQRQYWGGPRASDATTPGLQDYHGIPRLYLGWMVYFGDPSLRVLPIPA